MESAPFEKTPCRVFFCCRLPGAGAAGVPARRASGTAGKQGRGFLLPGIRCASGGQPPGPFAGPGALLRAPRYLLPLRACAGLLVYPAVCRPVLFCGYRILPCREVLLPGAGFRADPFPGRAVTSVCPLLLPPWERILPHPGRYCGIIPHPLWKYSTDFYLYLARIWSVFCC